MWDVCFVFLFVIVRIREKRKMWMGLCDQGIYVEKRTEKKKKKETICWLVERTMASMHRTHRVHRTYRVVVVFRRCCLSNMRTKKKVEGDFRRRRAKEGVKGECGSEHVQPRGTPQEHHNSHNITQQRTRTLNNNSPQ